MAEVKKKKHFILIHGACHGAWCWYKLKPRLESAGHRVTAVDMAASGINTNQIQAVHSMYEYTKPLLEILASLPDDEKAILVGHSLGGLNLALAMDKYPQKISAAVFLTAFMPDTAHKPSFVLEQYWGRTPPEAWLDTQFAPYGEPEESLMSMFFGPKFLTFKLYQLSPVEDLELAKALIRPGSLFVADLSKTSRLSNETYGSVPRVYIVCNEDEGIPAKFQRWMIENFEVNDVMEIKDADHMAMFSKPHELFNCLSEIAHKFG
ncbi:Methylesterase 3 [Hibiscus syriacus]|uniref:Methylesterase 3 n=1 Tax=Hibiscus syriacus TaxID=106335 RepID=A0A6A3D307_HIBSY|nr:salicylic acid-binding protein 2-like isoform X1 [Hibiscus syriacus]KAE8735866.1 Methylesterase 3 [Hibiscus syriacus]